MNVIGWTVVLGIGIAGQVHAETLYWAGADGAWWNASEPNWLTETGERTTWTSGFTAAFTNKQGGKVYVAGHQTAGDIRFDSSAGLYNLTGPVGALTVTGAIHSATAVRQRLDVNFPAHVSFEGTGSFRLGENRTLKNGVSIAEGSSLSLEDGVTITRGIEGNGNLDLLNTPSIFLLSGDKDCGISSLKEYTHLLSFGPLKNPLSINEQPVQSATTESGICTNTNERYGWSGLPTGTFSANIDKITSRNMDGIWRLFNACVCGIKKGTFRLTGLEPGVSYECTLYFRKWSDSVKRQTFTFYPDGTNAPAKGTITYDFCHLVPGNQVPYDHALRYRYQSGAEGELTIVYDTEAPEIILFGMSNERNPVKNPAVLSVGVDVLHGETPAVVLFHDDATCGITNSNFYTHVLNLGALTRAYVSVNGVTFTNTISRQGSSGIYGWEGLPSYQSEGLRLENIVSPTNSGIHSLLCSVLAGEGTTKTNTIRLSGLTPGKLYDTRLYMRQWSPSTPEKQRKIAVTANAEEVPPGFTGSTIQLDEDNVLGDGSTNDFYISCRSLASAEGKVAIRYYSLNEDPLSSRNFQCFALSNQEIGSKDRTLTIHRFTGDADCGISSTKVYTHALNFGEADEGNTLVNGVSFKKTIHVNGMISETGYGWEGLPPSSYGAVFENIVSPNTSGVYKLLTRANYYDEALNSLKLTGLTPGKAYELRLYQRSWKPTYKRDLAVSFDANAADDPFQESISYNADDLDGTNTPHDFYVAYRYTAKADGTITLNIRRRNPGFQAFFYALTNEESDLLPKTEEETVFHGKLTGGFTPFMKTGNGTFSLTGNSTVTSCFELQTGSLCVDHAILPFSHVNLLPGTRLYGVGSLGGDVILTNNATLQAGTDDASGTLLIAGSLSVTAQTILAFTQTGNTCSSIRTKKEIHIPDAGVLTILSPENPLPFLNHYDFLRSELVIDGPDSLSEWGIAGQEGKHPRYNSTRTAVYFIRNTGACFQIR